MIFVVLWSLIFFVLAAYLLHSPKIRGWLHILFRSWSMMWRWIAGAVIIVGGITLAFFLHPTTEEAAIDVQTLFENYSAETVQKIVDGDVLELDSACHLKHVRPELAYVLPMVINSYYEIVVQRPTKPVIARLDDTLHFNMVGYKQFKNRGILLIKLLRNKLGNRYSLGITSNGTAHTLWMTYTGEPWDVEQLSALPVIEIARKHQVDPALLMSLIRHVSNFNFDFRGKKDSHGILALNQGEGLEQIELGAKRLSKQFQVGVSTENAIATFYPDPELKAKPEKWMYSPLTKSWVNSVLSDIQFYHDNGLAIFK